MRRIHHLLIATTLLFCQRVHAGQPDFLTRIESVSDFGAVTVLSSDPLASRVGKYLLPARNEPVAIPCGRDPQELWVRRCTGRRNGPGGNLDPRVSRAKQSTNSPAAGEPVTFTARVRDDKEPTPPNIARVEIVYRVETKDGVGGEQTLEMAYEENTGVLWGTADGSPLERWTLSGTRCVGPLTAPEPLGGVP